MQTQTSESKYRWYVLALGVITHIFASALPWACMPVLFPEISVDLNLNLVQIGMVWGITSLPGIVCALFGGMLGDRFGIVKVLFLSCLLQGVACGLRGTAGGYTSLLGYTLLFGLVGTPIAIMRVPKKYFP